MRRDTPSNWEEFGTLSPGEIGVVLNGDEFRLNDSTGPLEWSKCKRFKSLGQHGICIVDPNNPGNEEDDGIKEGSIWFDSSTFSTYVLYDNTWLPLTVPLGG